MARNESSTVLPPIVVALTIVFGLSIGTASSRQMARTHSSVPQSDNSTSAHLAVTSTEVKERTIEFGEELVVRITLENKGKVPIKILPGSLVLKNEGWSNYSGGGSGLGESTLTREGFFSKEEFTLQPGESVAMTGSNGEMAAESIGPMKAEFVIETTSIAVRQGPENQTRFKVSYYVAPSKLMTSAWAARTPEESARLQPQIRDLLILASRAEEWRDRGYVEGTLKYLGCYALPYLESAMKDSNSIVRKQAMRALGWAAWSADNLNFVVAHFLKENEGRDWAAAVGKCDEAHVLREPIKLVINGLSDSDSSVRIAAISVLTERAAVEANLRRQMANNSRSRESMDDRTKQAYDSIGLVDPALPLIKKLAADKEPDVRAESQKFLSKFATQPGVAADVVASLRDPDPEVRSQALRALKTGHEAPPIETIEMAFKSTTGEAALGLIELFYEREHAELPTRLTPGFKDRSTDERVMILTAIAGHSNDAAFNLVGLGLKDSDASVQRAALLRLLGFQSARALSLLKANVATLLPETQSVGMSAQKELESRTLFPFLTRGNSSVRESVFPSTQGTAPMVSPDGKWVAYVETGWGRPGGSGGLGSSNLLSITHVVRSDGALDSVVSDMFLVGWMSDSRRIASARSGFAAIVNLDGKVVVEFGDKLDKPTTGRGFAGEVWPNGDMRNQDGVRMPHSKGFRNLGGAAEQMVSFDYGEDAAFSPDGKWFGPRQVKHEWQFIDGDGNKRELSAPDRETLWGSQAVWSPDGVHVLVVPVAHRGSSDDGVIETAKAFVIDVAGPTVKQPIEIDPVWGMGSWSYRHGRWNPWSRDGKRLAFIRQGQVWISDPDGNATQLTFDGSNKVFPRFSPDGSRLAYVTWQFDNREHYTRLGPTDIWVVDIKTGLNARVTRAAPHRIEGLDWLDNSTLIFDRLQSERQSSLRTITLK